MMEFKEMKDPGICVNSLSDSQCKENSVESNSATSMNQSTIDDNQLNKLPAKEIASISKEEVVVIEENSEMNIFDIKRIQEILQYTDSDSDDCIVVSTSQSNSTESQQHKVPSAEENVPIAKEEEAIKVDESDVCMKDASDLQDPLVASTSQLNSNESHQNKVPLEENLSVTEVSNDIKDSKSHRKNVHYSSESSDYETDSSSDSSDCDAFFENLHKNVIPAKLPVLKTKGELQIEDLPPVEDLHITVDATELKKIGKVLHTVVSEERKEYLAIVASDENSNPLNDDSVLFLSSDNPLGRIHEIFGNVHKPNYSVRFNKADDISNKGVTEGQDVYYLPTNEELTHYVLVDSLKQQKGSDASWKDNNEPPDEEIDYSDDEQEKLAKKKRTMKRRRNKQNCNDEEDGESNNSSVGGFRDVLVAHRQARRLQSPMFHTLRPSLHNYPSPRSLGPTPPPPSDILGPSSLSRNAISPRPFGSTPSNNTLSNPFGHFLPRTPSPQPFGPFPQSRMPTPHPFAPFPQSRVSTSFAVPSTSHVVASPSFVSPFAAGAPQQNSATIMAAPQNNVPLQQQFLLQSQQTANTFLSHPPPNYTPNQNPKTFLHQNQSFTLPAFGAVPAARPIIQNISNPFSSGTNFPQTNLSGHLNISQHGNITPTSSNLQQGQSYSMMQSNAANSFTFPLRNIQQNNIHPPITQPIFGLNQSPLPSPCPTPPLILCPTPPPPLPNQQVLPIFSSPHPPLLPCQTPPPTIHPFTFASPAARNPFC